MFSPILGRARLSWPLVVAFVSVIPFIAWSLSSTPSSQPPSAEPSALATPAFYAGEEATTPTNIVHPLVAAVSIIDPFKQGAPALNALDPKAVDEEMARAGVAKAQRLFIKTLIEEAHASGATEPTEAFLKNTVVKYVLAPQLSVEKTAELIAGELSNVGKTIKSAGEGRLPSLDGASLLLAPYLYQAGMCSGDIWSSTGLICGYLQPSAGTTAAGTVEGGKTAPGMALQIPREGSDLSKILRLALSKCQTQTKASTVNSSESDSNGLGTCFNVQLSMGRIVVLRLDEVQFAGYLASLYYRYASAPPDTYQEVLLDFLIELGVDELITVHVYGEVYAAANIRYLLDDSDSVFLIFPYGFKCKAGECKEFAECAAQEGADALACGDAHGERLFANLRRSGSYALQSIAACKTAPLPYQSRLPCQAAKQGLYQLPSGLNFQTKYQVPPSAPAPTDLHLYPAPTSYAGPAAPYPYNAALGAGDPTWRHFFTRVETWEYSLIFAGLKSVDTSAVGSCAGYRSFGDNIAYGDNFWMWHGEGHGNTHDCHEPPYRFDSTCPDYMAITVAGTHPMPTVNLIWGQQLAHDPVLCACSGMDCVPPVNPPPLPCNGLDCIPPGIPPPPPCSGLDCVPPPPPPQMPSLLSVLSATAMDSYSEVVKMKFVVRRDGNTASAASVNFSTSDYTAKADQDYVANSGTLIFVAGQAQAEISIDILPYHFDDGVKMFSVNLLNASGATIAVARAYGTIASTGTATFSTSELGKTAPAVALDSGPNNTCALLFNGNVQCWGDYYGGEVGRYYLKDTTSTGYSGRNAIAVSASNPYSCALLSIGDVQCWGNNLHGPSIGYLGGNAVAVSAGNPYSCALLSNGNVQCWGANINDQIAGYSGGNAIAVDVSSTSPNSAPYYSDLWHACALLSNGNVQCWGDNRYGQSVGYFGGNAIFVSAGNTHACALLSNGNVQCWGSNEYGKSAGYFGGNATSVTVADNHSCALLSNGNVNCWGPGYYAHDPIDGYSGGNAIAARITSNSEVRSPAQWAACALLSNGNVACWGAHSFDQGMGAPGQGLSGGNAIAMSLGDFHACGLLSSGNVVCWGDNHYNQLEGYSGLPQP
ncbi:MAG: Calx-beta domain-containing protein [Pseudomonadota bacterium]